VFKDKYGSYDRRIYARVPGKFVGVAHSHKVATREGNADGRVMMLPVRSVEGEAQVPEGFDVTKVTVRVHTLHSVAFGKAAAWFSRGGTKPGMESALPEIFDVHPDAHGRFEIKDVPVRGGVHLVTEGEGLGQVQWTDRIVRPDIAIRLTIPPESVLTGRVLTPEGAPAEGVVVSAQLGLDNELPEYTYLLSHRTTTDAQGAFTLRGLPKASMEVSVTDLQNRWSLRPVEHVKVQPDEVRQLELKMESGVLVSGRIVDPDGQPVARVSLVTRAESFMSTELYNGVTDQEGRYRFRVPSGVSILAVEHVPAGFAFLDERIVSKFEIQPGQADIENPDFTLQRGSGVEP
jgi:hypothetical protein